MVKHNANLALVAASTLCGPTAVLKFILSNNLNRSKLWPGKKACLSISFDCDYPADVEAIPHVLRQLSGYPFKTSFACVGSWIEKYPNPHKMILEYGHEIVNHTYSHPDNEILNPGRKFKDIPRSEKKEEIEKCHDACVKLLSYAPSGCRIPHFKNLFTSEIYGILKETGYVYSSSTWLTNTHSYGFPFLAEDGIIEFPLSTCPKHPFTVFDTWHSLTSKKRFHRLIHKTEEEYLRLARLLIDLTIEYNSYCNIYIDPGDIMKMEGFSSLLNYLDAKKDTLCVANYKEIADTMRALQA